MTLRAIAGAAPFAHLLRRPNASTVAAARAEETDEERKKREDEEEQARKAEEQEQEEEARRAEEEKKKEEDAKRAEEEKKKEEDAKRAEEEDEDKKKDDAKKAEARGIKAGREMERARGAAIFGCPAAGKRPDLAAELAFGTSMSADEAVRFFSAAVAGDKRATGGVADRMASVNVPNPGSDAPTAKLDPTDPVAVAAAIVAAGKKRRGEA